ncbi:cation/H(+) antiporter 2-like isoform X1 [Apium graveolens]|uniref:cation/H(+) antiporter 2-like isoform X1 n=2 Tax=Apium graveolens TaxID=4045 RepID=UPI003D79D013
MGDAEMETSVSRAGCSQDQFFNPILTMGYQVAAILVLSHAFQLVLKFIPGPIAQILAGFVLGPSVISNIESVKKFFFQAFALDYYEAMAMYARIVIMFLIGLELDVAYLIRNLRRAFVIALGGCVMCTIFAFAITKFIFEETTAEGNQFLMGCMIAVIMSNSGSPLVIRLAAHLRFATTDVGRLAISSSLISDLYAVGVMIIVSRNKKEKSKDWISDGFLTLLIIVTVVVVNIYLAKFMNRRNRNKKYLSNIEVCIILAIIIGAAMAVESIGYSSIYACFFIGSMFPRGGKTIRTLLIKLTYSIHNFIYPIYFGYAGFKADLSVVYKHIWRVLIIVLVILLSIGGKITGTLAACRSVNTPLNEGVLLAFLLNFKCHVDLVALTVGQQNGMVVSQTFYSLMTCSAVISSIILGPLIAYMVRRESETLGYRHVALESQDPDGELRILACVHSPRPVSTMVGLIATSRGSANVPITPYLMHLIELPKKTKTKKKMMHPQKDYEELNDEDDYGGNDVVEINEAVDDFTAETGVIIHQVKIVAPFTSMYEDVCEFAEDVRASIIIMPFHKHQRIDGILESGKVGIRNTNQKVLRHARCSVAILVDRGLTAGSLMASGSNSLQHVVTLFFGGTDDREALGFSERMGAHHHINLTVIRFLPARDQNVEVNVAQKEESVLMAISDNERENEIDNNVMTDFYNKYVTSGRVGYVEKRVNNGTDTASALRDMSEMYSMFIVGKGGRGHTTITVGISDWEECPELGTVGDYLASSDFDISGSVLVVQQHVPNNDEEDDIDIDEDR